MLSACGEVDLAGGADYTIFLINRQQAPRSLLLQWCEGENPFAQESATKQLFFDRASGSRHQQQRQRMGTCGTRVVSRLGWLCHKCAVNSRGMGMASTVSD
jgi:hypothetical protein